MTSYEFSDGASLDDLLGLPDATYAIEILGPRHYKLFPADNDYIIETPNTLGLDITSDPMDPKEHSGKYPQENDQDQINIVPEYIPEPQKTMLNNYKFTEPKYTVETIKGLQVAVYPKDTKLYKGIVSLRYTEPAKYNMGLSFYSFNPRYALQYAVRRGIGGLYVFKTTRPMRLLIWNSHNSRILREILTGHNDPKVAETFKHVFGLMCSEDFSESKKEPEESPEKEDLISTIIHMTYFYQLNSPWRFNKTRIKYARDHYPETCRNKMYGMKIDRLIGPILIKLGSIISFDGTLQEEQFSPLVNDSVFGSEIVLPGPFSGIVHDPTDPLDATSWKLPRKLFGTDIQADHIKRPQDADQVINYYIINKDPHEFFKGLRGEPLQGIVAKPANSLRIISYNIHGFLPLNTRMPIDIFKKNIMQATLTMRPDILFLPEYTTKISKTGYDNLTKRFKIDHLTIPGYSKNVLSDGRLTVAAFIRSNLNFRALWTYFPGTYNAQKKKGYITIVLDQLKIVGTHLSIYTGNDEEHRQEELGMILHTDPDIIIGDFNMAAQEIPGYTCSNFQERTTPYNTVDHIYIKDHLKDRIMSMKTIPINWSDHLPVLLDIKK